jgi:cell division transport system permease protein
VKDDADNLTKTLDATGKVSSTKYISKEDALAIYREQNKNDPLLLEMVTADILPASLEVSAKDPAFLKDLDPTIRAASGVEEVVFQKDVVDTLLAWTNAIRVVGGSVAIILALDSLLIIVTVIGMKIAIRREEIEILTLVGASPWYIRMPFIIEGGIYGAVGSVAAWAIITGLILWVRPAVVGFLGMIPDISLVLTSATSTPFLLATGGFLGGMLVIGFLLGSIGSFIALGRYLKI